MAENRESAEPKRHSGISFSGYTGEIVYRLDKGQNRVFSFDRY